jgi:hypothetical protein
VHIGTFLQHYDTENDQGMRLPREIKGPQKLGKIVREYVQSGPFIAKYFPYFCPEGSFDQKLAAWTGLFNLRAIEPNEHAFVLGNVGAIHMLLENLIQNTFKHGFAALAELPQAQRAPQSKEPPIAFDLTAGNDGELLLTYRDRVYGLDDKTVTKLPKWWDGDEFEPKEQDSSFPKGYGIYMMNLAYSEMHKPDGFQFKVHGKNFYDRHYVDFVFAFQKR